mmetsp:Transcript_3461/g.5825  ORF Transcript_3461/g.5825 Transcript_3461/m.5825 type:complete len:87 (-) Transcript_3461:458-718(-)|eukprot:CAMPEP_0197055338 /NCGR_PEP_ID=MMETSP1384-20130603/63510_1 /TAXON_ID=29189 /ORGANISM="Ammonia sp." /LENGTH=86 /DNA_ID=CAMNT_0042488877 /DNA_START=64 /DNA_END=324 /DNA_ORIENTATION=+
MSFIGSCSGLHAAKQGAKPNSAAHAPQVNHKTATNNKRIVFPFTVSKVFTFKNWNNAHMHASQQQINEMWNSNPIISSRFQQITKH